MVKPLFTNQFQSFRGCPFFGASMFILSLGLSYNLATTDNLMFSSNQGKLTLAKQAILLLREQEHLSEINSKVDATAETPSEKLKVEQINQSLKSSSNNINQLLEDTFE